MLRIWMFLVLKPTYSRRTRWILRAWLQSSPGEQIPWRWICRTMAYSVSVKKYFNCTHHLNAQHLQNINDYLKNIHHENGLKCEGILANQTVLNWTSNFVGGMHVMSLLIPERSYVPYDMDLKVNVLQSAGHSRNSIRWIQVYEPHLLPLG